MNFKETGLRGAYIITPERFEDERGFFERVYSQKDFTRQGIEISFVEGNVSYNRKSGTLRGMHYQSGADAQAKLVRCTHGAIYDVGVDLRRDSPTFKQWIGVELSDENRSLFLLPAGFAHGYLTLKKNTEVYYEVSNFYAPQSSAGVRWNDPAFNIKWPTAIELIINERDRTYPDFIL